MTQILLDNAKSIVSVVVMAFGALVGFVVSWKMLNARVKELEQWKEDYLDEQEKATERHDRAKDLRDLEFSNLKETVRRVELDNEYSKDYTNKKLEDIFTTIAEVNRTLRG